MIVAPSSQVRTRDRGKLSDALALLEGWGLEAELWAEEDHHFYLAGSDQHRAEHLIRALTDPAVRAIFCARGGYGSARLWPWLRGLSNVSPRLLIGFSDVTSLHLIAHSRWPHVECIHGPNLATAQIFSDTEHTAHNQRRLRDMLFENAPETLKVEPLAPGLATGRLVGGCLSLVNSSLGTPFQIDTTDRILLLEDIREAPYRIDRALVHLLNAGLLDRAVGVVFGTMPGCVDPYNKLESIVMELLNPLGIPVAFGLESGHGARHFPLRLEQAVELDCASGLLKTIQVDQNTLSIQK